MLSYISQPFLVYREVSVIFELWPVHMKGWVSRLVKSFLD